MPKAENPAESRPVGRKFKRPLWRLFWAAGLAVALAAFWNFWLFREMVGKVGDSSPPTVFRWRWGWAYEASTDFNGDGQADDLLRMQPGSRDFTCHYEIKERWLDADFDGKFEIRFSTKPRLEFGTALYGPIEIDEDGDSFVDRTLAGETARIYMKDVNSRISECVTAAKARKVKPAV